MIYNILIITFTFCISIFIIEKIFKYLFINKFIDWNAYLKFVLDSCYEVVYTKDIIVYITSNVSLSTSEAEYRKVLMLFINQINIKLGKLRKSIYIKYFFTEQQFFDYINIYLYERIQMSTTESRIINPEEPLFNQDINNSAKNEKY